MAQVTLDFSQKAQVEGFLNYLLKRAKDPAHSLNGDCVADFVDKFLVVELKRLEVTDEFVPGTIEIPNEFLRGPDLVITKDEGGFPVIRTVPATTTSRPSRPVPTGTKSKNGHESKKLRDLEKYEKDTLRSRFIKADGRIKEDATVNWTGEFNDRAASIGIPRLSEFQVPGFVAYLHGDVTRGRIVLNDPSAYKAFLDSHRALYPGRYPSLAASARAESGASTQADAAKTLWTNRS